MRIGINHQILPQTDEIFYAQFWNAIIPWVGLIRLDAHMDAYAWRVDPYTTYADGSRPMDTFLRIGYACKKAKIVVDFIRESASSSPNWRALGGDWSSFDSPNTWRQHQLPKEAWQKNNHWLNAAAKALSNTGATCRWQNSNEQFYRNKDRYAYERIKSIYAQPTYAKKWTSPTLWGPRPQLMKSLEEWLVLAKYEPAMGKAEYISVNVYPDWTPGITIDTPSNVRRQVENLILVDNWAKTNNKTIVVSEFGFAKNQIPEGEARRVQETAFVYQCGKLLNTINTMSLYWDAGDYYISPSGLSQLGTMVKMEPDDTAVEYVRVIQKQLIGSDESILVK